MRANIRKIDKFVLSNNSQMYNFDEIIDRRGTRCIKFDTLESHFGRKDLSALWVADMDFATPDFIVDCLKQRLEHPVLGYPSTGDDYTSLLASWVEDLHGWKVSPEHICYIPGIVKGIAMVERALLSPGDKVIIQEPVYNPFRHTAEACGFEVVNNSLKPIYDADGFLERYEMDLDALEQQIDEHCRLLVLSNPHNPCGVCFSAESLRRLAHICHSHGITVISDEIHAEMILGGGRHIPFASVSEEAAECAVTFMAPSKTFNIAGVVSSYCIIENALLRKKVFAYVESLEMDYPSIFSSLATRAAYSEKGKVWRAEMLEYVQKNIDFVQDWLSRRLPQVHAVRPQASFLVWLDCRKLGLDQAALVDLFVNKAGLALNDGTQFGKEGAGFMRLNVGCPRQILADALESLEKSVKNL